MDHHTHYHIAHAVDALTTPNPHPPQSLTANELVIAMADLATLAGLLGQLATQTRRQLAAWATVGAHLYQAEQHAGELRRCLNHACATLAFTTSPPTAANRQYPKTNRAQPGTSPEPPTSHPQATGPNAEPSYPDGDNSSHSAPGRKRLLWQA